MIYAFTITVTVISLSGLEYPNKIIAYFPIEKDCLNMLASYNYKYKDLTKDISGIKFSCGKVEKPYALK